MKKNLTYFFLIFISLAFFGCSDDENNPTEPTVEDYSKADYLISINYTLPGIDAEIKIKPNNQSKIITSASLTINQEEIFIGNHDESDSNIYYGFYLGTPGEILNCVVTLNGDVYNINLVYPYYPEIEWPNGLDTSVVNDFVWNLEADNQYQFFTAYGRSFDWIENVTLDEDSNVINLDPSARVFNMPINWIKSDLIEYGLILEEISFDYDDELVGICAATNEIFFGDCRNKSSKNQENKYKEILKLLDY